jgi:hypothetical protein
MTARTARLAIAVLVLLASLFLLLSVAVEVTSK